MIRARPVTFAGGLLLEETLRKSKKKRKKKEETLPKREEERARREGERYPGTGQGGKKGRGDDKILE